jgi:hypothetical protein
MHIQQTKTYSSLLTQTNPPQQLNKLTNIDEKKKLKNVKRALSYG